MSTVKINGLILAFLLLLILSPQILLRKTSPLEDAAAHPSDEALSNVFQPHREEFDRLIMMSRADSKVIKIAPDVTWLDDNARWPRPASELGFSQERWDDYRRLFNLLGLKYGLIRPLDANITYLIVSFKGWVNGGSEKGYAYSLDELSPIAESLDAIPQAMHKNRFIYKKLADHWYLYYRTD